MATKGTAPEKNAGLLQARIDFLEESNLNYLRTLDVVAACSELQSDVYRDKNPSFVVRAMFEQLQRLFPFAGQAMYSIAPDASFFLSVCEPPSLGGWVQTEIDARIADGTFAWALNQNHPVIVPTLSGAETLVLHVLATNSRIRGMYAGILRESHMLTEVSALNALSTVLIYTAYAVENSELTEMLKEHMQNLEKRVQQRTRELEAALVKAEEATRAKSVFLANMSHEIRTPLNGVVGVARILRDTPLNEEQKGYLDALEGSAENLLVIINDILDLSKVEAGKVTLEEVPFPLSRFLEKTLQPFVLRGREKGLRVELVLDRGLPPQAVGDPVRLGQILANLVGNALKFTEKGRIEVSCSLSSREGESGIFRFQVADTGIGIPLNAQKSIFEKFSQADSSTTRLYGGTGLGLSICKNLVELMGGELRVESCEGVGSEFSFTARLGIAQANDAVAEEESNAAASALRPLRILVVDDVPLNRLITCKLAAKSGDHSIDSAANGREAVEKVLSSRYDLVFMDVQMPEMDGLEATRLIRSLESGHRVQICAMTANAMKEDADICREAGMDSFLSKPVQERELHAVIGKVAGSAPDPITPAPEEGEADPEASYIFDREDLLVRLDGMESLTAKFLAMFVESVEELMPELIRALERGDSKSVHFHAHTIAGSAANIGAGQIRDLAREIEARAKEQDTAPLTDLYRQLQQAISLFVSTVEGELTGNP